MDTHTLTLVQVQFNHKFLLVMCDTTDFHSGPLPSKIKGGIAYTDTIPILFCLEK